MKRSIVTCVILTIVTLGIYGLYWLAKMNDETHTLAGHNGYTNGITVIILTIVTCGIYSFYWAYKMGEAVEEIKAKNGAPAGSSAILFLILNFFGIGIWVNYCLIQDNLNKYALN